MLCLKNSILGSTGRSARIPAFGYILLLYGTDALRVLGGWSVLTVLRKYIELP